MVLLSIMWVQASFYYLSLPLTPHPAFRVTENGLAGGWPPGFTHRGPGAQNTPISSRRSALKDRVYVPVCSRCQAGAYKLRGGRRGLGWGS